MLRAGLVVSAGLLLVALGACAAPPPPRDPLAAPPRQVTWPDPPETPRYAYVGTLIGEKDFTPENSTRSTANKVLSFIVGMVLGERSAIELERPVAGMVDDKGRLLVVDGAQKAVILFDLPAGRVAKWSRAATDRDFAAPVAVCGDGERGYLVTDAELHEVFRLAPDGEPSARFGHDALQRPTGVACDRATGTIYVADTARHQILAFDAEGHVLRTLGRRGTEIGEFNYPTHLVFAKGELYVADTLNFRIQVLDPETGRGRTFGEIGIEVGKLARPKGVAVGRDGRVYVVESYFDHLLVFGRDAQFLMPIGGSGNGIGEFYLPAGVWTDATGRVYVADMFNGRVVVLKELTMEQPL